MVVCIWNALHRFMSFTHAGLGEDCVPTVSSLILSKAIHQGHASSQLAHSPVCVNKERAPTGRPAVFGNIRQFSLQHMFVPKRSRAFA
jgi:hypothetical protein